MATSKTIHWGGVASTTVPGLVIGQVTRSLLGTNRGTHRLVGGRRGSIFFGQPPGTRTIRAQCFIEAETFDGRRDTMELLADWLDITSEAKLRISDEPGIYYLATLGDIPDPDEWREFSTFDLEWVCQPYAFDVNTTLESWTSDTDDTHTWDPGLKVDVEPVIEVKPTNGTLTSFRVTTNDKAMRIDYSLSSGSTITVNGRAMNVTTGADTDTEVVGAYNPANLVVAPVSGKFPTLISGGNNSIRFQALSGTATQISIKVIFRKQYRK